MSARVLLVDDVEANRKLLSARLASEYYVVSQAANGQEALDRAFDDPPDVILLDVMMPGIDGYEVCRRLREEPTTRHVPIVMISSLDQRSDRIRGLEAGADDFLTKPVDPAQLIARMRSLTRHKAVIDELRSREASARKVGALAAAAPANTGLGACVLLAEDEPREADWIYKALSAKHRVVAFEGGDSLPLGPELVIVSLTAGAFDGLGLIARLRTAEATRRAPILAVADPADRARALQALDLGANDLVYRPVDAGELAARVRTLVSRMREVEALRAALDQSAQLAVTDQLTGLHNRRYLVSRLQLLLSRAARGGQTASVILMDIDHFKRINDVYGHDVGDEVLREFAARLAANVRAADVACRFGGEEFLVALPGARTDFACLIGERFRRNVAAMPFRIRGGSELLPVTVSLGVASIQEGDTVETLFKRADAALYKAKTAGRNRLMAAAAAA